MAKSYSIISISTASQTVVISGDYTELFIKDNTSTFTLATEFEIQNNSFSSANKKYKVYDSAYSPLTNRTTVYIKPEVITSPSTSTTVSVPALPTGSSDGPNLGKITNTSVYLFNFKQDSFVVSTNQTDTASSSLSIPGRYVSNYGEDVHQNVLRLTESFAGTTPPENSAFGQLWFDTSANTLKVKTNSTATWQAITVGITGTMQMSQGGTGVTSIPSGFVTSNGTTLSSTTTVSTSSITGVLPLNKGGTGRSAWQTGIMKQSGGSFTTTNLTSAEVTTGLGYTPVNKAGDTMTGFLVLNNDPTAELGAATKKYVDSTDYLNFDPLAGVLEENNVPIYSDFQFSLGAQSTQAFGLTDDQNIEIAFFHVNTPANVVRPWRAYRFTQDQAFIFDSSPMSVSFEAADEYISSIMNIGSQFAYLELTNSLTAAKRRVVAKTGGNSKSANWTLFADVTSITTRYTNIFLLVDSAGDRILRTTLVPNSSIRLDVFDQSLTLLRGQDIYVSSDVTDVDQTAAGRTLPAPYNNNTFQFGYFPPNCMPAFTWNKFTDNLLMVYSGYHVYTTSDGDNIGQNVGLTVSWNIPKTWFIDGTGTPTNLVPVKSSGFRYHKLPDSTWDTNDGGVSTFGGGVAISVTTNELSKNMTSCYVGTWTTTGFRLRKLANQVWSTIGNNVTYSYNQTISIPDAAPWSKNVYSYNTNVIDDNVQFIAVSNKFGTKLVNTKFSTSTFASSSALSPNDTLILDGLTWQETPSSVTTVVGANQYSTTVLGSGAVYHKIAPGSIMQEITVTGGVRSYTATAFTLPAIPATIGVVTGITWQGQIVYNGNSADRKFWAIVRTSAVNPGESLYVAEYSSGAWSNIYGPFMTTQIIAGNTNRGDSANNWNSGGCPVLTNNGKLLCHIYVPVTGGTSPYILEFNINTATATVHAWNKFAPTSIPYSGINSSWGISFGYSSTLGYYCVISSNLLTAAYFVTSKNASGTGVELTEDQWFNGSAPRYQVAMTTEPAVGLFAYVQEYPIFLGGYYTKVPSTNLALSPNTTQYVYAEKTNVSRDSVDVTISTDIFPNSFSKVALAKIVTDSVNVTEVTSYTINSRRAPNIKLGNGSAASPSLSFAEDSITGIFKPSASTLGFSVNGGERMRLTSSGNLGIGNTAPVNKVDISGSLGRGAPITKTDNFTVGATENWLIVNKPSAPCTITLPAAASWTGREIMIKTIQAQTVISNTANVVPLVGGAASTDILSATAGKWATLVSDGTNWIIMAGA